MGITTLGEENPKNRLLVFDRFRVDAALPKWKRLAADKAAAHKAPGPGDSRFQSGGVPFTGGADGTQFFVSTNAMSTLTNAATSFTVADPGVVVWNVGQQRATPVSPRDGGPVSRRWWVRAFRGIFGPREKAPRLEPVEYVFHAVLGNDEELKAFNERNEPLRKAIELAERAGQATLIQQYRDELQVRVFENALHAKGMRRFVSEAQLLKFVERCERGLCLDWIANFSRPIPEDVVAAKVRCDEAELFDNYVVLHYDPHGKATTEMDRAKEQRRVKDPILFGVIHGSRKLYFVADWTDELCDLTFQQIVEKLGEGALEMP